MAFRRRYGSRRKRYSRRSKRRSYRRRTRRSTGRRRYRRAGPKRAGRAEWKKVEEYSRIAWTANIEQVTDQSTLTPICYFAPRPHPPINQGTGIRDRIGNSLSRMVWKLRWSCSLQQFGVNALAGNFGTPTYNMTNFNLNGFLRVIVYQMKRGDGLHNPYDQYDDEAIKYHPVNVGTNDSNWTTVTNPIRMRFFAANDEFVANTPSHIPMHLARFRVNINDEINLMYDKTYSLNTQGRSTLSKRWSFKPRPYKWDEGPFITDTMQYPQNAIRVMFLSYFPFHELQNDNFATEGLTLRVDFASTLRYTDF